VLDRWEERGLVARDRLLGHLWIAPTAKARELERYRRIQHLPQMGAHGERGSSPGNEPAARRI
jgi:hypothetical protein